MPTALLLVTAGSQLQAGLAGASRRRDAGGVVHLRPMLWACAAAALASVAAGDASAVGGAVAAAAGTAFEAAPFLVFTRALGPRLGPFAALGGCGCARAALPGALALPAIALCALAFGPLPAFARTLAAGALVLRRRTRDRAMPPDPHAADPLADLERLGASAFLASLAATALATLPSGGNALPAPLAFVAGLVLGALAPCATAGIALAAAFAGTSHAIAAGTLCTAGLCTLPSVRPAQRSERSDRSDRPGERDAKLAAVLFATALAWLAICGPSGLVTPRLLIPIAVAAALVLWGVARERLRTRATPAVPLLMLATLVAVPQPPLARADATRLDDAYPGERLAFTGVVRAPARGHATLTRYAITCCRLDASPVSVRLDRGLAGLDGRWVSVAGTLRAAATGGLELHARDVRAIAPPADPFLYR